MAVRVEQAIPPHPHRPIENSEPGSGRRLGPAGKLGRAGGRGFDFLPPKRNRRGRVLGFACGPHRPRRFRFPPPPLDARPSGRGSGAPDPCFHWKASRTGRRILKGAGAMPKHRPKYGRAIARSSTRPRARSWAGPTSGTTARRPGSWRRTSIPGSRANTTRRARRRGRVLYRGPAGAIHASARALDPKRSKSLAASVMP